MTRVHLISHTPLDAAGGVPRFNRYLKRVLEEAGHEVKHWSGFDISPNDRSVVSEPSLAAALSRYLHGTGNVTRDDVIIGDGFWCGDFSFLGYRRVISVAHGIWSHLTKDDVDAGLAPENVDNHRAQVRHRIAHRARGLPIVAVSEFIAEQMRLQWGFESTVINNAVDPDEVPTPEKSDWWQRYEDLACNRPVVIVHGVNDRGNANKGWDHIEACQRMLDEGTRPRGRLAGVDAYTTNLCNRMNSRPGAFFTRQAWDNVTPESIGKAVAEFHRMKKQGKRVEQFWPLKMMLLSLDEFHVETGFSDKMQTLQHADAVLIPSGYEGNSYFALEAMNCGVPVVAYDVGLFREISLKGLSDQVGIVMPRSERSPERTAEGLHEMLTMGRVAHPARIIEKIAKFSDFAEGWRGIVKQVCQSS